MELKTRKKIIEVTVYVCPKCNSDMAEERNLDYRTMWHYYCPGCDFRK